MGVMNELYIDDILIAKYSVDFPDYVTEGNKYRVSNTTKIYENITLFKIINDQGREVIPINSVFNKYKIK